MANRDAGWIRTGLLSFLDFALPRRLKREFGKRSIGTAQSQLYELEFP